MLEKIGLPAKPSLRGNSWVVDASHCQGCSSQFNFINRKHHCRRCGGLFCGSCTQQRMSLRGQGDSPVRICDPCKQLEEAARFELRHGYKNRAAKGGSKRTVKNEDDVLSEILGSDVDVSSSSESDRVTSKEMGSSSSMELDATPQDEILGSDVDVSSSSESDRVTSKEMGSSSSMELDATPEELRKQAVEEKNKYRVLKQQGKSEEALKAFKRGKELERQADALEISLRKDRKRALSMRDVSAATQKNKAATKESSKSQKPPRKDDLAAELRDLGWSDDEDKKPATVSLEGEFSSLLREIPGRTTNPQQKSGGGIDKSQVIAIKKKALALKREGKLAEAKEELKRAKVLEREIEEQELLGGADESDDELSALINSMDDDKEDDLLPQYEGSHDFDIGNLVGTVDDIGVDGEFDVTDEDMEDPAIASALKSLGWTEDPGHRENLHTQSPPNNREERLAEIQALKREALTLKRAGNAAEALATLKKAKLLERELESAADTSSQGADTSLKHPPRSRLAIQRELLAVKKKALTLKREGKFNEAEEELKKGAVLQEQLEELDNSSKLAAAGKAIREKDMPDISVDSLDDDGEVDVKDEDVTENDMKDPALLSTLKNLGWEDEEPKKQEAAFSSMQSTGPRIAAKTKGQIQRELLDLKRKALAFKRQGKNREADELYSNAKVLEAQLAELETPKDEPVGEALSGQQFEKKVSASTINPTNYMDVDLLVGSQMDDKSSGSFSAHGGMSESRPSMIDLLTGEQCERSEFGTQQTLASEEDSAPGSIESASVQNTSPQNTLKQDILAHKRKALALKKEGKISEAKEALQQAKLLERRLQEGENPSPEKLGRDGLVSATQPPVVREKENSPSSSAGPKPMSSRDRFKLQQESLSHKRQAMKLRREGKMEEAEAEFEIAKTLEAQLEDSTSSKSEPVDDNVAVEDFLDPQLLSALKAIGLDSPANASASKPDTTQATPKPVREAVKPSPAKESDNSQERSQLEERIKAEKIKAVTLKRSGKQAEALDALRRAKLYEKKLNALA
ncbi:BnaC01g29800D [Brassica napus]|uniref:BnaC01g29800D protein n=1 Tax=Brassica napus TaxID=3708 RepID=A0A078GIU4_BRANA|nr:BnaC01g29800D [Brassica napus]